MQAIFEKVDFSPGLPFYFRKRIGQRLCFNWHYHHEWEITLIIRDRGQLFIGSGVSDYAGISMYLIKPDIPHSFVSDTDVQGNSFSSATIQFSPNRIGLEHLSPKDFLPVYRLFENSSGYMKFSQQTCREVLGVLESLEEDEGLPGLIDLLRIIDLMSRDNYKKVICYNTINSQSSITGLSDIEKVLQFISTNYSDDIHLSDAAEAANLSVPSFCRFFKDNLNTTFTKYLTEIRIGWACKFLIQTDMAVSSISFRVGFNNLSNFNRRFFELKNKTPREYRKQYRQAYRQETHRKTDSERLIKQRETG